MKRPQLPAPPVPEGVVAFAEDLVVLGVFESIGDQGLDLVAIDLDGVTGDEHRIVTLGVDEGSDGHPEGEQTEEPDLAMLRWNRECIFECFVEVFGGAFEEGPDDFVGTFPVSGVVKVVRFEILALHQ